MIAIFPFIIHNLWKRNETALKNNNQNRRAHQRKQTLMIYKCFNSNHGHKPQKRLTNRIFKIFGCF